MSFSTLLDAKSLCMKYCSKHHSNPDDAVFCSECGEKLIEQKISKKNVCPKCHNENPNDAIYCSICGYKLNNVINKVELTIYSNIVCKSISLCGTTQCVHDTSKAVFKVEPNSNIDILFDSGDGAYYRKHITIDNTPNKNINIEFGTIHVYSYSECQIKMLGSDMDCSLNKTGYSNTKIKAPYGTYEVVLSLDGEKEKYKVDLNKSDFKIFSNLQKKYKIIIGSDICIDTVMVEDKNLFVNQNLNKTNTLTLNLPEDKYNIDIYVNDIVGHTKGYCRRIVDLKKDTNISLKWCKLSIDTNAEKTIFLHLSEQEVKYLKVTGKGIINQYIVRGDRYMVKYGLSTNITSEEISACEESSLKLTRKWKDVVFYFNKAKRNQNESVEYEIDSNNDIYGECMVSHYESNYDDYPLIYDIQHPQLLNVECIYEKRIGKTSTDTKLLVRNLSYGRHKIAYRPNDNKYKYNIDTFRVDDNTEELRFKVLSKKTDRVKWNWLRKLIFYTVWFLFLIPLIAVPIMDIFYLFESGDMDNALSIIACMASGITASFVVINYFIMIINSRVNKNALIYFALLTVIIGFVSTAGNEFDLGEGNDRWAIFLVPLGVYVVTYFISNFIYKLKIKNWSIYETLLK